MAWDLIALGVFLGLSLGGLLGWGLYRLYCSFIVLQAQSEVLEIQQESKDLKATLLEEEKEQMQAIELELWTKHEPDLIKFEEKIENLTDIQNEQKTKHERVRSEMQKRRSDLENTFRNKRQAFQKIESRIEDKELQAKALQKDMATNLLSRLQLEHDAAVTKQADNMVLEAQADSHKMIERRVEQVQSQAEQMAKRLLDIAIDRFARPYCPERGIGPVYFPDAHARKLFCDPQGLNAKTVSQLCGCDLVVEDQMEMIGVAGFDPVRRELTRRVLERLMKEKKAINPDVIKRVYENHKKELFRTIQQDGESVAREMGCQEFHPEIKMLLGSLRYRYSFTQNQHFHVAEVGWLAGLLAHELRGNFQSARRSGVLHDIGKAMDHQMEGGHAMIGADFIEKRGEVAEIVHNVRAHHFDTQPNTDEAFMLIAADAVSGARPGARRSTMETYNQKVSELQEIARSFAGVTDCFVLNGGRECRILVNSRQIDDHKALEMSANIAKRIEEECNYPGQIRVVVVRETIVTESTKVAN